MGRLETVERPERTIRKSIQMIYRSIETMRGAKRIRGIAIRIAVAISALSLFPDFHAAQGSLPNLRPHQPREWSDRIVVSNVKDTRSDSSPLRDTDDLFVDFAAINAGAGSVTESFRVELFVDGRLAQTFDSERSADSPLMSNYFASWSDYWIGRLSAGTHTLKIVVDTEDSVSESNERDNEYSRTITVRRSLVSGCFALTTGVVPRGAGTITPSRTSTCTATTGRLSSLTQGETALAPPLDGPVVAVEPAASARRARVLAELTAKVQAEGRVRVIVGLRPEGGSEVAAPSSFKDSAARAAMVRRVDHVQQELLVRMSGHSISSVRRFKYIPYLAMEVEAAALEALVSDPEVLSIEEDKLLKPMLEESVPLVGAPQAWSQGFSGAGQTIAIVDTGVDKHHRFLAGKVVSEACYSGSGRGESLCPGGVTQSTRTGSGVPCSDPDLSRCFHGTHMAGIAAGRGPDFSGVARDAGLISIQVFSKLGPDDCPDEEEEEESDEPCMRSSLTDQISGLERVLELSDRFDVAAVNLSLGTVETFPAACDNFSPSYKAIVDNLRAVGIAAVSSSGNEKSSTGINFPGCISSVVSVGSTDDGSSGFDGSETTRDEVSDFSNSSPGLDLLAPGRWITSSYPENRYATAFGTSLAVPHVAGAWAVLKSKAPNASVEQVLSVLKSTGVSITDSRNNITRSRIRVDAALGALESQPRYTYTSGTSLTLTASPNSGFVFKSWRGCDSLSGNRCTVRVSAAKNVTALFQSVAGQGPLQPPYQLTATPLGPHRIRLHWRDDNGENARGFRIERRNQGGDWGLLVWLWRGRREFVDGSVEPERSYSYRMVAYDQDGNVSDWSGAVTATTLPVPAGDRLTPLTSRRWVIPTTANLAGRFGGIFKTNLTLANLSEEDIEVTARLFGAQGLVKEETISLKAVTYSSWNNFLGSLFEYRGAGAVEFTAEKPFQVASVEVFIDTSSGRNTTVVLNQPTPPLLYTGSAISLGVNVNDDRRTNIGVFNSSSQSQTVTARVHSGERGADPVQIIRFNLPAKGYSQKSVSARVENGFISWLIPREAYLYVVSVDNSSNDGTLTFPIPLE